LNFSIYVVPIFISAILIYGLVKKVDVFSVFIAGAREGLVTAVNILPALVALLTAVGMLRASGALDALVALVAPAAEAFGFPAEVLPGALMRPISGSGSLAVLENTLTTYGADSVVGRIASVMQGSSETTFYTLAVYFGAVNIKKTGAVLPCAIAADFAGFVGACVATKLFMG